MEIYPRQGKEVVVFPPVSPQILQDKGWVNKQGRDLLSWVVGVLANQS